MSKTCRNCRYLFAPAPDKQWVCLFYQSFGLGVMYQQLKLGQNGPCDGFQPEIEDVKN